MSASGKIVDYLGAGVAASRPSAPNVGAGVAAVYVASDTGAISGYDGSTWHAAGGGGGGSGLYSAYLCYQHQATSGTHGGTATAGAWADRPLTTEVADTGNHGVLASNEVTLDAGTYQVRAAAVCYAIEYNQLRLYNVTDSALLVGGVNNYCGPAVGMANQAILVGRFTISGSKVVALQYHCSTTVANDGFGLPCSLGTEIYATLELFRE